MDVLEAHLCDVWGDPLPGGVIVNPLDDGPLTVTVPHCDSMTASVTVSVYDPVSKLVKPLETMLAVTYGPFLVFKGPIVQPRIDFGARTVAISAHDITLRLKHHYHRFGDRVVDDGYPVDGRGMRRLVESSVPTQKELSRNVPPNGILWGENTVPNEGPKPADLNNPQSGDGLWRFVQRGQNVWESVQNLRTALPGPEFAFQPIDAQHPRGHDPIKRGFVAELDTAERIGTTEASPRAYFEHGSGSDNAETVIYEPDGDMVRNWFRQVRPSGEKDRGDASGGQTATAQGSQSDYGLMQGWESSQQQDSKAMLREKARVWVAAYGRPPDFFQVVPRPDRQPNVPRYLRDFKVGDMVRVVADRGERQANLLGRVMQVQLAAIDQSGNAKVTLTCIPDIDVTVTDE